MKDRLASGRSMSIWLVYRLLVHKTADVYLQLRQYMELVRPYRALLHQVRLQFPLVSEQFLRDPRRDLRARLCALPEAARLQAVFGTPVPMFYCGDYKVSIPPVIPLYSGAPRVHCSGRSAWLSCDSLMCILQYVDLQTVLQMRSTCREWAMLCGDASPVWTRMKGDLLRNPHMDRRKDFLAAIDRGTTARHRFQRALFVWLAKNPRAYPLGRLQAHTLMHQLWNTGKIPRSMATGHTHAQMIHQTGFPPLRACVVD